MRPGVPTRNLAWGFATLMKYVFAFPTRGLPGAFVRVSGVRQRPRTGYDHQTSRRRTGRLR
jgi:hypothetical protein